MYRFPGRSAIAVMAICLFAAVTAAADPLDHSFTGSFNFDDTLQLFQFVASSPDVTVQTWGYGGTDSFTNAGGQTIASGGFDPVLSLFDTSGGSLLNPNNVLLDWQTNNAACGGAGSPQTDPATGFCFDATLTETSLTPGATYLLVLSQNDNEPLLATLGDGFSEVGNGDFTGPDFGCSNGSFCDVFGDNRTGSWAVDIDGATSAQALPEPGTAFMMFTALGAVLLLRRRYKTKGQK